MVGTEYVSSETMRDRWLDVITHVRSIFDKQLVYSANWDHFDPVSFWDAVDVMGVTAYHKLTQDNLDPSVEEMTRARWEAEAPCEAGGTSDQKVQRVPSVATGTKGKSTLAAEGEKGHVS